MPILPDSNALVNFFKEFPGETELLEKALAEEELFISPVVVAEILTKASESEERQLEELLLVSQIVPVTLEIGRLAGDYRKQFSRKTNKVYLLDCFLAATCKAHDLALITNNLKDYPMKDIKIIKP